MDYCIEVCVRFSTIREHVLLLTTLHTCVTHASGLSVCAIEPYICEVNHFWAIAQRKASRVKKSACAEHTQHFLRDNRQDQWGVPPPSPPVLKGPQGQRKGIRDEGSGLWV